MLDDKTIGESEARIKEYLRDGTIKTRGSAKYAQFFQNNAQNSLDSAQALYTLSTDGAAQKALAYSQFNGFLWVINASYYSMFYMVRALLEHERIEIKGDRNKHMVAFDALVHFFYKNKRLEKKLLEDLHEAGSEAGMALAQEKAFQLVQDYHFEKTKRGDFTYEVGLEAIQSKAKTSLERAKRFNEELKKLVS